MFFLCCSYYNHTKIPKIPSHVCRYSTTHSLAKWLLKSSTGFHFPGTLLGSIKDFLCFYKFIYFWLRWVFVAARGLSLVVARGGLLFVEVCMLLIVVASRCGAWALGVRASVVVECGLNSCVSWALRRLSSCGTWA